MKALAPLILLLSFAALPAVAEEVTASPEAVATPEKGVVYAKVILPMKAPAEAEPSTVESWIARRLKKLGATEVRAVTGWVRLTGDEEKTAPLWNATLDGKLHGCPAGGRSEHTPDGTVRVILSGWSPVGASVKGASLPAEIGSRTIAVVDTGRADGKKSYVALFYGPRP
jgi:hypothetical protein